MNRTEFLRSTPAAEQSSGSLRSRILAGVALAVALVLLATSVADGSWAGGQAVSFRLARCGAVQFACALPAALWLRTWLRRRCTLTTLVMAATLLVAVGAMAPSATLRPFFFTALLDSPWLGTGLRAVSALGFALALVLLIGIAIAHQGTRNPDAASGQVAVAVFLAIFSVAAPATYVAARCRSDLSRLSELLAQSRVGEARDVAYGMLVLDAGSRWNGESLRGVALRVNQTAEDLEKSTAQPLPFFASQADRFQRARQLAMLGKPHAALEELARVTDRTLAAQVEGMRGVLHESLAEYEPGLHSHARAKTLWEARPISEEREQGLVKAVTGMAYCQRKLGWVTDAEASYQEVLTLAPTADSHFLLAQFYENIQQAGKAREHARQAMALAPERYGKEGERLIRKLTVFHFGCLQVFQAEGR